MNTENIKKNSMQETNQNNDEAYKILSQKLSEPKPLPFGNLGRVLTVDYGWKNIPGSKNNWNEKW